MLPEDIRKSLIDIDEAIDSIEGYLSRFLGERRDFNVYVQEKFLRRCVERELEIVGEAMNRILRADPAFVVSNARKIVNLRNHVAHVYDKIDDTIIWGIVTRHLPLLKAEVERLLG